MTTRANHKVSPSRGTATPGAYPAARETDSIRFTRRRALLLGVWRLESRTVDLV